MSFDDICKQNLYKFINQCGLCYRTLPISLILTFIYTCNQKLDCSEVLTSKEIEDMNLVIKGDTDLNNFLYLIPKVTRICFYNIYDGNLNVIEQAVLAGVGLQMKSINEVAKEINYSSMGIIRLFQEIFKKTLKK
ncbi:NAT10 [Hepatospora eriocheir]|uniref:NAT10 n=1 Tax=Hepatospora eriocheir TaxID=1081669 RepID=A0A1X0QIA5_9MICR|nr:NAT10 [Hepatospora eriocheir]